MVLKKHEIEKQLHDEHKAITAGHMKEDNPLDSSESFRELCEACRRGDLKTCQEKLQEGVNINARDRFDYTPLILASLCGHYEVVQFLIESGALCERDTFQGERCLYNALNDRIRNLLLSYDYSKSRDPLQPFAAHISSLLNRPTPHTFDITLSTDSRAFQLHKFILAARSPYFARKLRNAPDTATWKVPPSIPTRALEVAIIGLYFGEISVELGTSDEDQATLAGIDKLGKTLEIQNILEAILETDRRLARQKRSDELEKGQQQLRDWFEHNVLAHTIRLDHDQAEAVKWDRQNGLFADVLLCAADDEEVDGGDTNADDVAGQGVGEIPFDGIPIGPRISRLEPRSRKARQATLFPAHRAMLLRSEYFNAMFSSPFKEAQQAEFLPVVNVDCNPDVLRHILLFIYTEQASFGLDVAIDILFTSDALFLEKLKMKAATIVSTLGHGGASVVESDNPRGKTEGSEEVDIYEVIRAGWDTRVHRLEEFGARYIAYRLEKYIDTAEFLEIVQESAGRIQARQETDTVELIDDIRYYLSERFRMRFEDPSFDQLEDDEGEANAEPRDESNQSSRADMKSPPTDFGAANNSWAALEPQPPETVGPETAQDNLVVRTLDGEEVSDEFAQDALNYQILLGKIDTLLEKLRLDA